jgi:non-lysosomal glucosylceramidase
MPFKSGDLADRLSALTFENRGVVTRDDEFAYRDLPCRRMEGPEEWEAGFGDLGPVEDAATYPYLFERESFPEDADRDGFLDPPTGMRSAVPLGGLGSGTVELRADGSLREWLIFNNSPAGGEKVNLDGALFGVRSDPDGGEQTATTLRTHPPDDLPAVRKSEYSGAFPASRLRFSDPDLDLDVTLYGYSEFEVRDPERSASPAAAFTCELRNPTGRSVEADLLFALPNHVDGTYSGGDGLALATPGESPTSGEMVARVAEADVDAAYATAGSVAELWRAFEGGEFDSSLSAVEAEHGGVSGTVDLDPGETRTVTVVLSWYFPHRPHGEETVGNYYTTLYEGAADAARAVGSRLPAALDSAAEWQRLCLDTSLPDWLGDALVNSLSMFYKTGMWVEDGRWRHWEAFSVSNISCTGLHFTRSLPYVFFFPSLQRQLLEGHADRQYDDGRIPGKTFGNHDVLDPSPEEQAPGTYYAGVPAGDQCTAFVLETYQRFLWAGDEELVDDLWPAVEKAITWQLGHCEEYGLPRNLECNYDWFSFGVKGVSPYQEAESKELVTYNAFLHLAALRAGARLADARGADDLARRCREGIEEGRAALTEYLWTGDHFRAHWSEGQDVQAVHADALYGQLWAFTLGLGPLADTEMLRSHLRAEADHNSTPYGLTVLGNTDRPRNTLEDGVWQVASLDWSTLQLHLGADPEEGLRMADRVVSHWQDRLADQWNYSDVTAGWDGYPFANNHYCRQLLFWAIPLALSGQEYSAREGTLCFDPSVDAPAELPVVTPDAHGTLTLTVDGRCTLELLSGTLELAELSVGDAGTTFPEPTTLQEGQSVTVWR